MWRSQSNMAATAGGSSAFQPPCAAIAGRSDCMKLIAVSSRSASGATDMSVQPALQRQRRVSRCAASGTVSQGRDLLLRTSARCHSPRTCLPATHTLLSRRVLSLDCIPMPDLYAAKSPRRWLRREQPEMIRHQESMANDLSLAWPDDARSSTSASKTLLTSPSCSNLTAHRQVMTAHRAINHP